MARETSGQSEKMSPEKKLQIRTVVDGLDNLLRVLGDIVARDINQGKKEQKQWKKQKMSPVMFDIKLNASKEYDGKLLRAFNTWSNDVEKTKQAIQSGLAGRAELIKLFNTAVNWRDILYFEGKNISKEIDSAKYLIDILPEDDADASDSPSPAVDPRAPTEFSSPVGDSWGVDDRPTARATLAPGAIGRGKLRGAGKINGSATTGQGNKNSPSSSGSVNDEPTASETDQNTPSPEEAKRQAEEEARQEEEKIREGRREWFERTKARLEFMREKIFALQKMTGRDLPRADLAPELSERQLILEEALVQLAEGVKNSQRILSDARADQNWEKALKEINRVEKKFKEMKEVKQKVTDWVTEVRKENQAKEEAEAQEKKKREEAKVKEQKEELNRERERLSGQVEETRVIYQGETELKKVMRRDFLDHHLKDFLPAPFVAQLEQFYNNNEVWDRARVARDLGEEVLADFKKNKKHSIPELKEKFVTALSATQDAWQRRQDEWKKLREEIQSVKEQVTQDYEKKSAEIETISNAVRQDCVKFLATAKALDAVNFVGKINDFFTRLDSLGKFLAEGKKTGDPVELVKRVEKAHQDLTVWRGEQKLWGQELLATFQKIFNDGAARIVAGRAELKELIDDFYWRDDEREKNKKFLTSLDNLADYFVVLSERAVKESDLLAPSEIASQKKLLADCESIITDRRQELADQKKQAEEYEAMKTAKKIRAKVKKPKVADTETPATAKADTADTTPEPVKPPRPLVKKPQVEKTIDKFLRAEKVVDIPPAEIMRSLSEKEMEILVTAMETEDELSFTRVMHSKIELLAPRLSAEAKDKLTGQIYDTVKRLVNNEITAESLARDGQKLAKLKIGGRVAVNLGWSLGVGAGVGLTLGTGALAAGAAGATTVAGRLLYKNFMASEAGRGLSAKIKKVFGNEPRTDKAEQMKKEAAIRENAVDNVCIKENLAVIISNFLREETTREWVTERDKMTVALAGTNEAIPEKEYQKCVATLSGPAQKEFFINSLNYVNVAPEYAKVLSPEEKVVLAQLVTLTVGASQRTDLETLQALGAVKQRAKSARQPSWLAGKLKGLFPRITEKISEKVAGHIWAGVLGAAVSRAVKEISPTWRITGGAVTGAVAGLSAEQSARRGGAKKYETEAAKIAEETTKDILTAEKMLAKYETRPIEKISVGRLNKITARINELQSRADSGVLDEMAKTDAKILRSRLSGLVYRARKMESAKAMEMEKAEEILMDLVNMAEKNNRVISQKSDKLINRLKKATRDRTAVYMLGGAMIGAWAGYLSADSGEKPEWLNTPAVSAADDFDEEFDNAEPTEVVAEPAKFVGAERYAPGTGENPLITAVREEKHSSSPPVISSRPLIVESAPVAEIVDPAPVAVAEPTISESVADGISEVKEETAVWLEMLKNAPKDFRDNLNWLNTTLRSSEVSEGVKDQLKEFKNELYRGFNETGVIDATRENEYFKVFKNIVAEDAKNK